MEPDPRLIIFVLIPVGCFLALFGYLRHQQNKLQKDIELAKKEQRNDFSLGKGAEADGYIAAGYNAHDKPKRNR